MGRKKRPFYRIVAADSRMPRDGRFLSILGTYDPLKDPPEIKIDEDKVLYWLSKGAQMSDTARHLLKRCNVLRKFKELKEASH